MKSLPDPCLHLWRKPLATLTDREGKGQGRLVAPAKLAKWQDMLMAMSRPISSGQLSCLDHARALTGVCNDVVGEAESLRKHDSASWDLECLFSSLSIKCKLTAGLTYRLNE